MKFKLTCCISLGVLSSFALAGCTQICQTLCPAPPSRSTLLRPTMDFSPRVLLKVSLPGEGFLDATNVGLPQLPEDTDLDEFLTGPDVLMVRIAGGTTWPDSWDVAFN